MRVAKGSSIVEVSFKKDVLDMGFYFATSQNLAKGLVNVVAASLHLDMKDVKVRLQQIEGNTDNDFEILIFANYTTENRENLQLGVCQFVKRIVKDRAKGFIAFIPTPMSLVEL